MLKNEKYMGDLLLQKYYIPDFLTKKVRKNIGELPQYYVENAHAPIVPKEVFLRAQGILLQRKQTAKRGRVRNENALFGSVICGECGDIYNAGLFLFLADSPGDGIMRGEPELDL